LVVCRRWRAASQVEAALHTATMQALVAGKGPLAASYARELVARAPLEESGHVLLVKSLAASGDVNGARDRVAACEQLFTSELGLKPSSAVSRALRTEAAERPPGLSHKSSALTLLEAGTTAVDAGAIDAGIECLRQAVADAEASKDTQLYGKCQGVLGSALIHGIRGFDDEGSLALHSAVESAAEASDPATAATALMELGYVELLAGVGMHRQPCLNGLAMQQQICPSCRAVFHRSQAPISPIGVASKMLSCLVVSQSNWPNALIRNGTAHGP